MNEQEHQRLRIDIGAYVLDQLSDEQAAELERHLDGCARCTAELAALTPVAQALGQLREHPEPEDAVVPPHDLGDRVVAAVDRGARRETARSWSRTASLAAAAVAAVLVGALGARAFDDAPAAPTVPLETVAVQTDEPGVRASADLVDHTWGVEVKLHTSGLDSGARYRATVLGVGGERYAAGGFVGTGTRAMDCNLNSSVLRERAAGFEVSDAQGDVVISSEFG